MSALIAREQNAACVDEAARQARFPQPNQGWIRTVRSALAMSGAALSQRLGGHRSTAAYLERAEQDGSITLKKLAEAASAMNCELVYAVVPKAAGTNQRPSIDDLRAIQAHRKAASLTEAKEIALAVAEKRVSYDVGRKALSELERQLTGKPPRDFWLEG